VMKRSNHLELEEQAGYKNLKISKTTRGTNGGKISSRRIL
jgi:hypothetical protein